ncbi:MAG: ribonuclease D [Alphaproteobacteria bacterium]
MRIITNQAGLEALCAELQTNSFLCVDTEFLRDTTYWPRLCLVQVAGAGVEAIIDPLAQDFGGPEDHPRTLAPLVALLSDEGVLKVFHAARQDMELFVHRLGVLPKPIFDSQIAAMVCGFGESVGYETLVKSMLSRDLDKSSRFTDWSRRPLTEKQLAYAMGDVTHLRDLYPILAESLAREGRAAWVAEEVAALENPSLYTLEPEDAWRRLKTRNTSRKFMGVLKALAAWRECEAQGRDVPRARIVKDDALLELAGAAPQSKEDMERLRGVPKGFANSAQGRAALEAVAQGLAMPREEIPVVTKSAPTPAGLGPLIDLLRVLLKTVCEDHGVAGKLIATSADLERIAAEDAPDVPALSGWRREIFGDAALRLKDGRLALGARGRTVALIEVDGGRTAEG